jgi:hypothetical protein
MNFIYTKTYSIIRYIPLGMAIVICLSSVNILNLILLIVTFILLTDKTKDKYWHFYLLFLNFNLIIKMLGDIYIKVYCFNIEYLLIVGFVSKDNNIKVKSDKNNTELMFLFILSFTASIYLLTKLII